MVVETVIRVMPTAGQLLLIDELATDSLKGALLYLLNVKVSNYL